MEKKQWLLNGEVFQPKIIGVTEKPKFKETNTRVTTYLENNLHLIIQMLLEHKQIESITAFINEGVRYYLMNEKNYFGSNRMLRS